MANAKRDENRIPTLIGVSSSDGTTPVNVYVDPTTHRLKVDVAGGGGSGTVTSVSVVSANGFAGSVATATTTPAITLTTTITGILSGNGTAISAASTTGSGSVVLATSPTLVTPVLGAATATSINGLTITSSTGTLTLTNGKTLSVSNTLTFTGTDSSSVAFGAGGTVAYTANKLSVFAATTSAELAGVISDETGSGLLVFGTAPTLASTVTIGTAGGTTGAALFKGTTSGTVTLTTADAAGTWTMKLPTSAGTNTYVLQTDGTGVTSWVAPSAGTMAIGDSITSATEGSVLFAGASGVLAQDNTNFFWNDTNNNLKLGNPSLVSTAKLNVKVTTGNDYNLFLEGTGGAVVPTIGFKHATDSTGVSIIGGDSGFSFSNIGEGITLFMKPGYPDSYWKTHGSSAAKFHIQSYLGGTGYLDSHVVTSGWNAFGHATPDRLMHPEVADTGTNAVVYASRTSHVTSGTAATGFGVGEEFELENASGTNRVVATQEYAYTDATNATEDANYKLRLIKAGTLTDALTVDSLGNGSFAGGITLLESTSIALDPALSADGKWTGITRTGTAGAALAFGDLCYLDPTDSRWELADANAASGADGDSRGILGICVLAAAADGDATNMLLYGNVQAATAFPAITVNAPYYVSETAGDITGTQPTTTDVVIRVVGFGLAADEIMFNPSPDYITHV